jgi:hypothetical protein
VAKNITKNIALPRHFKLNDYTIYKKLSTGGFSIVYLAYDKNNMPVAIKEFFPTNLHLRSHGTKIDFISMRDKFRFRDGLVAFKDETEIVMKLKHKNIIEIINFFEMNDTAYIVMPYEYGQTLSKYITVEKDLTEKEMLPIIEGLFSAVQVFHENNIIHLDLKPGNIWLRPNKEALILDFGTARVLGDSAKSKQPPAYTKGYAAPEQHREFFQASRIGVWTDYYGLGATLYALIEKSSPNPSPELLLNEVKQDIVQKRKGQISVELLKIVEDLMTPEWEKRKKINLKEMIQQIRSISPISPPSTVFGALEDNNVEILNSFSKDPLLKFSK